MAWLDEWHGQSDIRHHVTRDQRNPRFNSSAALLLLLQSAFAVINDLNCAPAPSSAPPAGLSLEEVREYERTMQEKTNCKVKSSQNTGEAANN